MNLFTIENLFITILSVALALIIYKYAKNFTQRIWALFNLSVALWAFCIFLVGISTNENQALIYWKYAFVGVALLGDPFLSFCSFLLQIKPPLCACLHLYLRFYFFISNSMHQ